MLALAMVSPVNWKHRLGLALVAGAIIAAFHVLTWPHCVQRLEGLSPEAERLWLSHVKEARPVYMHGWRIATLIVALPITGVIGWGLLIWWRWSDRDLRRRVIGAAVPGLAAALLLLWQTRTGPAAQMMAVVGGAALVWILLPKSGNSRNCA